MYFVGANAVVVMGRHASAELKSVRPDAVARRGQHVHLGEALHELLVGSSVPRRRGNLSSLFPNGSKLRVGSGRWYLDSE